SERPQVLPTLSSFRGVVAQQVNDGLPLGIKREVWGFAWADSGVFDAQLHITDVTEGWRPAEVEPASGARGADSRCFGHHDIAAPSAASRPWRRAIPANTNRTPDYATRFTAW